MPVGIPVRREVAMLTTVNAAGDKANREAFGILPHCDT